MDYLEKQVQAGKDAASFIDQEAWKNAVAKVKEKYHQEFINSKIDDAALRESVYRKVSALADIELELRKTVDNGLHAASEVQRSARKNK